MDPRRAQMGPSMIGRRSQDDLRDERDAVVLFSPVRTDVGRSATLAALAALTIAGVSRCGACRSALPRRLPVRADLALPDGAVRVDSVAAPSSRSSPRAWVRERTGVRSASRWARRCVGSVGYGVQPRHAAWWSSIAGRYARSRPPCGGSPHTPRPTRSSPPSTRVPIGVRRRRR